MLSITSSHHRLGGFTLPEISIVGALTGVVGLILVQFLWQGLILFTKNTAINVAHQQARSAVMRIESDLHGAVSVPQLIDAARNPVLGYGPAPGIAFHIFAGGPFKVASGTYAANQKSVTLVASGTKPVVGQRLNITTHSIENFITAVSVVGSTWVVTLDTNLRNVVDTSLSGQEVNISCFTTDQVSYLVESSELRKYARKGATTFTSMSSDVTSTAPFSIPQTAAGAPYNRFVAAINLSCAESNSQARNFKAANMFLNSMVPYRSRLTQTQ